MTRSDRSLPPFLLRGAGRAIDMAVHFFILEGAFRVAQFLPEGGLIHLSESVLVLVDLLVGVGVLVLYTAIAEWLGGATLGKWITQTRVVMFDGTPVTFRAANIRGLGFFMDALFFGLVAYSAMARSETNQRVGDEWAGTLVVWKGDAPDTRPILGWPVGIVAAVAVVVSSYLFAS